MSRRKQNNKNNNPEEQWCHGPNHPGALDIVLSALQVLGHGKVPAPHPKATLSPAFVENKEAVAGLTERADRPESRDVRRQGVPGLSGLQFPWRHGHTHTHLPLV